MKRTICAALSLVVLLLSGCAEKQLQDADRLNENPTTIAPSSVPHDAETNTQPGSAHKTISLSPQVIYPVATVSGMPTEINEDQTDPTIELEVIPQFPSAMETTEPTTPTEALETSKTQPEPINTNPKNEVEPTPTMPVIPTLPDPLPAESISITTEPVKCSHEWYCIYHNEMGHWIAGVICDCGWVIYGNPEELVAAWNAHSASYSPSESLMEHGGFGSADEWVVDSLSWEEWLCSSCGEHKP